MPAHKTALPKPGDDTCPQCFTANVETHKCRATGKYYCDAWDCMKKAGMPLVVNPAKRAKKEPGAGNMVPRSAELDGRLGENQE